MKHKKRLLDYNCKPLAAVWRTEYEDERHLPISFSKVVFH